MKIEKLRLEILDKMDAYSENVDGYTICFHVTDMNAEETADHIAQEVFDNIVDNVENDNIYAIGWLIRRYKGDKECH